MFFCQSKPIVFFSVRRYCCKNSLLLPSRNFATMVTWCHNSPFYFKSIKISCNTNLMLQDSPQSTGQLLNQVHMMSQITCPLIHPLHSPLNRVLVLGEWCHPASSSFPCSLPSQLSCFPSSLSSPLSIMPCTRCMLCHPASRLVPI